MAIITSKWILTILLLVLLVLAILYLVGRKSVHSEITIQASSQEIWLVLTDIQKIKEWNPVLVPVEGELKEGVTLKYEFYQEGDEPIVMSAKVKEMIDGKLLNQAGGMFGILTFDHKYILEPSHGETKVIIHEDYRGIAVPFWNPAPVEKAYIKLNEALRDRVTQLKKMK